jgi:hypothetical protein
MSGRSRTTKPTVGDGGRSGAGVIGAVEAGRGNSRPVPTGGVEGGGHRSGAVAAVGRFQPTVLGAIEAARTLEGGGGGHSQWQR